MKRDVCFFLSLLRAIFTYLHTCTTTKRCKKHSDAKQRLALTKKVVSTVATTCSNHHNHHTSIIAIITKEATYHFSSSSSLQKPT